MAEFPGWAKLDVHILIAGSDRNIEGCRLGMGFLIGARHVLTCAHVVSESLDCREQWINRVDSPPGRVTLAFAFSAEYRQPIQADIEAWWPEYDDVENRTELDDVALLRLPEGFVLPGDVEVAVRGTRVFPGQEVFANGVSETEQNGLNFAGWVRGPQYGNRMAIRTEGGDGNIVEGYSGAAAVTSDGVIGMFAEKQQQRTGLFLSIERLLQAPSIAQAWKQPRGSFVDAMTPRNAIPPAGVAAAASQWLRLPIGARLQRHLHYCDRVEEYGTIEDVAFGPPPRRAAVAVFGCDADDSPEALYDRLQSQFLVEGGHPVEEIAYPPRKWSLQTLPWRQPEETVESALAGMKRRLVRLLTADGPEPKAIRNALRKGGSRAFYSEVDLNELRPEDATLMKAWSAYLVEIGSGGLRRSLMHLLCIKSPQARAHEERQILKTEVKRLATAGEADAVLQVGLLPCLDQDDLSRWLESIITRVPLDWAQVYKFGARFAADFPPSGAPRLRQVEQWLASLDG